MPTKTDAFRNICELLGCARTTKVFVPLMPDEGCNNWKEAITVRRVRADAQVVPSTVSTVGFRPGASSAIEPKGNLPTCRCRPDVGGGVERDE
jgi:hypothetical protein